MREMDKKNSETINIENNENSSDQLSAKAEDTPEESTKQTPDYYEMLQRLQADFDNYRRRSNKEKEELANYVRGEMIRQLLPILDDLERLLNAKSEQHDLEHGARLIYKNFLTVLKNLGMKSFTDQGKDFDPNIHEALSVKKSPVELDGKIVETLQKGYWLKDKLLRPAKVIVGQNDGNE